jgi:uncharacterized protein (TIGR02147 family)
MRYPIPDIFTFTDYRKFLASYYEEKKTGTPSFSYHNFALKAGFTSKSAVLNVIRGRKNLSKASGLQLAEAMGLDKREAAYFEALVSFNQARNFKERAFSFERLNAVRPQSAEASSAKRLRQDQFEFYAKWYHVVIRSLIDAAPFKGDYRRLASLVYPAITPRQARDSVELLQRLGLAEKADDGSFRVTDNVLTTGPDVTSLAVQRFHLETMELAAQALQRLAAEERNISGLTLGISKEAYGRILDVIRECQQKIMDIAEKDRKADGVYQLNFHFFPVSRHGIDRSNT